MPERRRLTRLPLSIFALLLFGAPTIAADEPIVWRLRPEVIRPEGLNENDKLKAGDEIVTGPDGMVVVQYTWRTDLGLCTRTDFFGYGQDYTVDSDADQGKCVEEAQQAARPEPGQPFLKTLLKLDVRSGEGKSDWTQPSDSTQPFGGLFDEFFQVRSYSGMVTRAGSRKIEVRATRSGANRTFEVPPQVHVSPKRLEGREVRVDFTQTNHGYEAVRIDLRRRVEQVDAAVALVVLSR